MHELTPLIQDLAIMLGVAGIVTLLFQKIHQPIVLGYLIAGIIIGPYTPPHALVTQVQSIKVLSELGVIFLMFSLGLEFSFHKLVRVGFSASISGFLEVVVMMVLGYWVGYLLGWDFYDCVFLGAALSISSTTIIIKAIEELGLMQKRFAELVFGILVVEDMLAILLLVVLSTIVTSKNVFSLGIAWSSAKLILVVGSWFLLGYFLLPPILRKVMKYATDESITIVSVGLCLFLVVIAANLHYSTALGAFIMGSILAETPFIHRIEYLIKPIRDIFAAVFFISIGMLIDPLLILKYWPAVLVITLVTVCGKLLITGFAAFLSGQSLNTSLRVGFSMAQIGEFSFIIVGLGAGLGVISHRLYPIIVAVSCVTTFTTPYFIRGSGFLVKRINRKLPPKVKKNLEDYSAWVYRFLTSEKQEPLFRKALLKLAVNGIVVAALFAFINNFICVKLLALFSRTWLIEAFCWGIILLLASPFLWGMLFSLNIPRKEKRSSLHPLLLVMWMATFLEVFLLSIYFFQSFFIIMLFLLVITLFFIITYKHLGKTYYWFEERLIGNIKRKHERSKKYEELAPWDTHLVEMDVSDHSVLVDKKISDIEPREKFGINIVAIYRRSKSILAPRGDEFILAGDKLIVLGVDEKIELFRKNIEAVRPALEISDWLANFSLEAILLNENNRLIGKSIRETKIREKSKGIIVGLERNGHRILNPNPNTLLEEGDLLFIVGLSENIRKLFKSY
jgi:CPA2 family monovalent cation:H+ antiporter-2